MIVVDASVVAGLLLGESGIDGAMEAIADRAQGGFVAPDLIAVEVASAVLSRRRAASRGRDAHRHAPPAGSLSGLPSGEVWGEIMRRLSLIDLGLEPMSGGSRLERAFAIAELTGVSIYDAVYLSLAQEMRAPIATLDGAMTRAARELGLDAVPGTRPDGGAF